VTKIEVSVHHNQLVTRDGIGVGMSTILREKNSSSSPYPNPIFVSFSPLWSIHRKFESDYSEI